MCGIVGYIGYNQATPILLNGLSRLEYRGYDSAGVAVFGKDGIVKARSEGKLVNLKKKTESVDVSGTVGIGHTRWATHGEPNETNCHPHTSMGGKFVVVHNGIIENYDVIKKQLIENGIVFSSETDTEVVPQLLEYYYDGDLLEAVRKVTNELTGSYALGILCEDFPDRIVAARKSSPLIVAKGEKENFIASDISAILDYTKTYTTLEDGDIVELKNDQVRLFDKDLNEKEINFVVTDLDLSAVMKNGFDHFMLKEINEQPEKIKGLYDEYVSNGKVNLPELEKLSDCLENCEKIYAVACGSAYHTSIAGKYVIEQFSRIGVEIDIASEFRYRSPILNEKTPVIIISQSGETADSIAALRMAKQHSAPVIGIVNVVGSTIYRESDCVLYTKAGPEIAVATTKGYATQLMMFYFLALYLAEKKGTLSKEQIASYCAELETLPGKAERLIKNTETIQKYSEQYKSSKNFFFIGRNTDYAAAMEASLKVKEISYISSDAYASGELKHGTIALIDKGTPVISFCANKRLFEKAWSNAEEVVARGADVICVVSEKDEGKIRSGYGKIVLEDICDEFSTMLEVIAMQIFAYYIAKGNGCDIDKPKNLAKSVTVE
ncbi:MAG: glutamine--fructose-6-phosphate transaminase (isomerizing) [Clostridia bacterium]|nr:glutamine--fructose-6-phosphate transaminase (isomerizing) [Clostridia bacterium]